MKLLLAIVLLFHSTIYALPKEGIPEELHQYDLLHLKDPKKGLEIFGKLCPQQTKGSRTWFYCGYNKILCYEGIGDAKSGAEEIERLLGNKQVSRFPGLHSLILVKAALAKEYEGNLEASKQSYERAIELSKGLPEKEYLGRAYLGLSWFYARKFSDIKSTEFAEKAFDIAKSLDDKILYYEVLNNIGLSLTNGYTQERNDQGRRYLREALRFFQEKELHTITGTLAYNLGLSYTSSNLKEAIKFFQLCKDLAEKVEDEMSVAYALYGMGQTFIRHEIEYVEEDQDKELIRKAFPLLIESNKKFSSLGNEMMAHETLVVLVEGYSIVNDHQKTIELGLKIQDKVRKDGSFHEKKVFFYRMYESYKAKGLIEEYANALELAYDYHLSDIEQDDAESFNELATKLSLKEKEFKNRLLKQENQVQAERLEAEKDRQRFMLVLLICAGFLLLALFSIYRKNQKIIEQRKGTEKILGTIDEGILILDHDLKLQDGFSEHLKAVLPNVTLVKGISFLKYFFKETILDEDSQALALTVLKTSVGENDFFWDINTHNLPSEVTLQNGKVLSLSWQPFYNDKGIIHKFLVSMKDITESKKLDQEKKHLESIHKKVITLVYNDKNQIVKILDELEETIEKIIIPGEDKINIADEIKNPLHKLKGLTRSLKIQDLSEQIHVLETYIRDSGRSVDDTKNHIDKMMQTLKSYREAQSILSKENKSPWYSMIESDAFRRLEEEGYKKVRISFSDSIENLSPDLHEIAQEVILHGLTNAIDHGFINPAVNKSELVQLDIDGTWDSNSMEITISDNGAGLNLDKLKKRAAKSGFEYSNDLELSQIVFEQGISTVDEVTKTSGMGTGLAAIKNLASSKQGHVKIHNNQGESGTTLTFWIPLALRASS